MRISTTIATVVGAGVGLVAAGATYAATASQPTDASPVSATAPHAVTTTVVPTVDPACSEHAVLTNGVCVVTLDHTTTVAPRTVSQPEQDATRTSAATRTRHTEEAEPDDDATDATEHAQGDDDGDDHGEHAEDGDDHGDHAEGDDHGDDSSEHGDDHGGDSHDGGSDD